MTSEPSQPIKLFVAYAEEDEQLKDKLERHLAALKREGLISVWNNRDIKPGDEKELEKDRQLNTADIILLLVSADFIASDYLYSLVKTKAMERHNEGKARVVPIILHPCDWQWTPIGRIEVLPTDGKPVISTHWYSPNDAFFNVAEGIRKVVNDLLKERWLTKGIALRESQQYDEALAAVEKSIQLDANYAQAYCEKGIIISNRPGMSQDYQIALASFEKAIQLNPVDARAYFGKGTTLSNLGQYEEALVAFEKALQFNSTYAQAYYGKGIALGGMHKYNEALTAFEKAIQLDPNFARAYYGKGIALCELQRDGEALDAFEKAIQLNPKDISYYSAKAQTAFGLKRYKIALAAYEQIMQIDPKNEEASMGKGNALYELTRYEEALIAYEQVIHLNPYAGFAYRSKERTYERLAQQVREKIQQYYICSECGYLNPAGSAFCDICGRQLTAQLISEPLTHQTNEVKQVPCPECGYFNPEGAAFCDSCGSPLSLAKPLPQQAKQVLCSNCGHFNSEGEAFCSTCGAYILSSYKRVCSLGHVNHVDAPYCDECGEPLNQSHNRKVCSLGHINLVTEAFCDECGEPLAD